jgi:hypothetical protein
VQRGGTSFFSVPREAHTIKPGGKRTKREIDSVSESELCLAESKKEEGSLELKVGDGVLHEVPSKTCNTPSKAKTSGVVVETVIEDEAANKDVLEVTSVDCKKSKVVVETVLENELVEALEHLLEDVSRQQRERKAVTSDDAEVPERLWEEHLTAGSEACEWDAEAMDDLRRVSSWLRDRMLRWWK